MSATSTHEQPSAYRVVGDGVPVVVRTGQAVTLQMTSSGYGYVLIWAPEPPTDGSFVLLGVDEATGEEVYRHGGGALAPVVAEATSSTPPGTGLYALWFSVWANEHGREVSVVTGDSVRYELVYRPSGTEDGEYSAFHGKPWHHVFMSLGGPEDGSLLQADYDRDAHMAGFAATQFYLGDTLRTPEPTASRPASKRAVDRKRVWAAGTPAEAFDFLESSAAGLRPAPPATGVSPAGEEGQPSGTVYDPDPIPNRTRPVPLPDALDGAETWVTLYARADYRKTGAVWGGARPEDPEEYGRRAENRSEVPVLVGVWKADSDGQYHHAAFPRGKDGPGVTPEVVGPPVPYVLVPTRFVSDSDRSTFAHVFYAPPPRARVDAALEAVRTSAPDALTPLDFATDAEGNFEKEASHARADYDEGVWKWYLPDPLRVPLQHQAVVQKALERRDTWVSEAAPVLENAGLLATACFDPGHNRGYLVTDLGARAPSFDPAGEWAGESYADVPAPATDRLLDHFRFGVAQQQAYLDRQVHEAGRDLDEYLEGRYSRGLSLDLVAAGRPDGAASVLDGGTDVLLDSMNAVREAGTVSANVVTAFEEGGVLDVLRRAVTYKDLETALSPLREVDSASWVDGLSDPDLKLWWRLARKGGKQGAGLFTALLPTLLATEKLYLKRDVRRVASLKSAVVTSLFAEDLHGPVPAPVEGPRRPLPGGERAVERRVSVASEEVHYRGFRYRRQRVEGTRVRARRRGVPTEYWRIEYERGMTGGDVIHNAEVVAGGLSASLNLANIGLVLVAVHQNNAGGTLGARDALQVAKLASDVDSVLKMFGKSVAAVRLLGKAGPMIDSALGAMDLMEALEHERARGVQRDREVDQASVVGAALVVASGVLGTGALVATGPVSGTLAFLGVAANLLGGLVLWVGDRVQVGRQRADDDLTRWIAKVSMWGQSPTVGDAALALARPGWTPGAVEGAPFRAETEAFLEEAFTFPTSVEVVPGRDGVRRLVLWVVPEYVPEQGALLVSANVASGETDPITGEPYSVPVRCVVHYVTAGGHFAYTVRPERAPLSGDPWLLAVGDNSDRDPRERIAAQDPTAVVGGWAPSAPVPVAVDPSGDPALPVYLGDGWLRVPDLARGVVAGASPRDAALARIRGAAGDPTDPLEVAGEFSTPDFMALARGGDRRGRRGDRRVPPPPGRGPHRVAGGPGGGPGARGGRAGHGGDGVRVLPGPRPRRPLGPRPRRPPGRRRGGPVPLAAAPHRRRPRRRPVMCPTPALYSAVLAVSLLAAALLAGCGSDARPSPAAPCGPGPYVAVVVLDAVRGAERVTANGYPLHVTYGPGSAMSPGSEVARPLTPALVSGRNAVVAAVAPAVEAAGLDRTAPPRVGPARFRAWVCGPGGAVVAGDPASAAASDSAFAAWRAAFSARWPGWVAAEDSALAADPALADSLAALVARDRVAAATGAGPALDSARAWAAAHPVAVAVAFVRPGGGSPSDGEPSFDAVLRDAPVIGGTPADSARLRAYAVRLRDLAAAGDTALRSEVVRSVGDAYARRGRPLPPADSLDRAWAAAAAEGTGWFMWGPGDAPFEAGDVRLRSWAGGRVWELYRDGADGLFQGPGRGPFKEVFVGEGPGGALRVVR